MPRPTPDVIGNRYNMLVITGRADDGKWIVKCDCGNTSSVRLEWMTRKEPIRSCGCIRWKGGTRRIINVKHHHASDRMAGRGPSKFYRTWSNVKRAAKNPETIGSMDDRWEDFAVFLEEVPMHPEENGQRWSLVRIDDTDDWHKDNVEWVTASERGRRSMLKNVHGIDPMAGK